MHIRKARCRSTPPCPIKNAQLKTSNAVLAYARVLDLWGVSGKFDAIVPYTMLSGTAEVAGHPFERNVNGFADPKFRLSVNLYGAPALTLKEFKDFEQDLIVGASLQVSVPAGQYDDSRVVNIGTNRWSFKPEIGISQAMGPWTLELQAAASFFTDNTDFFGGNTRSQDPIYSLQGHAIYGFRSGIWASLDATYFTGGRTTLNGVRGQRPAAELAAGWHAGVSRGRPQFRQALRQQRRIGTHRQQLRPDRDCLAVPLGRRAVSRARLVAVEVGAVAAHSLSPASLVPQSAIGFLDYQSNKR